MYHLPGDRAHGYKMEDKISKSVHVRPELESPDSASICGSRRRLYSQQQIQSRHKLRRNIEVSLQSYCSSKSITGSGRLSWHRWAWIDYRNITSREGGSRGKERAGRARNKKVFSIVSSEVACQSEPTRRDGNPEALRLDRIYAPILAAVLRKALLPHLIQ